MKIIRIPEEIIYKKSLGKYRTILFCFLESEKDADNLITFTPNNLTKWTGKSPNTRKGCMNDHYLQILECFKKLGYIDTLTLLFLSISFFMVPVF